MNRTPLFEIHKQLGAKMVAFAGWEMPVYYSSITAEHQAVRHQVGLFDVSHMGRIKLQGKDAAKFADFLVTNKVLNRPDNTCTYAVFCREDGTSVDDLLVFKHADDHVSLVVNASNREKDFEHCLTYASNYDVNLEKVYLHEGILAIQGPSSKDFLESIFPDIATLKPMRFMKSSFKNSYIYISRTGYTGELGYEIYVSHEHLVDLFQLLLDKGKNFGIAPIGLGARDTLRLEMGFALYGHELSDTILPTESVAKWAVKLDKPDFIGKSSLVSHADNSRYAYGIEVEGKGIAREGALINYQGKTVGKVTSGTFSPSLQKAIALVLVDIQLSQGDKVEVLIRNTPFSAIVTNLPFYKKPL